MLGAAIVVNFGVVPGHKAASGYKWLLTGTPNKDIDL